MSNEMKMTNSSSDDEDMETDDEDSASQNSEVPNQEIYMPGRPLEEGEELVCDPSAYVMLHQAQTGAPCLSFDIIPDAYGQNRDTFPLTSYLVAGTQAEQAHVNSLIVMKLSNLHRTNKDQDKDQDDEEESDDEDEHKNPQMAAALIKHMGCTNRIRCTDFNGKIVAASWSELGRVNLWDLTKQLQAVDNPALLSTYNKDHTGNSVRPLFTFSGHQKEGYGIDWSKVTSGMLATGDCKSDIHVWKPNDGGVWDVDQRPLLGHKDSVEDLQWSPNEATVLASCSVDKSVRIWDIRAAPSKACMLTNNEAHESDVNVISWNRSEPFIVSGGDDGYLHVWDLRRFKEKAPVATFKHHTDSITTVEWHPTDSTVFASGGSDNQISLWDLAVEKDSESEQNEIEALPPQLLFIHQGQTNIKELHWHPQMPGVVISTALSGFNIFRTISV